MMKGLFAGVIGLGAIGLTALQLSRQSSTDTAGGSASAVAVDDGGATQVAPVVAADAGTTAGSRPAPRSRAAARTDAGAGGALYIGDPPGRLSASADGGGVMGGGGAADAGDAGAADSGGRGATSVDAGSQGASNTDEVQRLRERVAALEQELARSRSAAAQSQQVEQLNQLNQQVASLREQLAQEQGRRQAEENAARQAASRQEQAVTALSAAQQQLAAGDSRVMETLQSASGSLPAPAQRAVETARSALQSGDLSMARYWLSVAIAQTQQAEIKR